MRVPLAVDAQIRVPVGPVLLPLRAVALVAAACPLALLCLAWNTVSVNLRVSIAASVLVIAFTVSAPVREGVWIGTWLLYRRTRHIVPSVIFEGSPRRARVRSVGEAVEISAVRPPVRRRFPLQGLASITAIPSTATVEAGVIRLSPGGARAVLLLEGPNLTIDSDAYAGWCSRTVSWLLALDCPAQLLTVVDHFDSHRAQLGFDRRTEGWPRTPLAEIERDLSGRVAEQSLGLRHFVILAPGLAARDGIPSNSTLARAGRMVEADDEDAARALQSALRTAPGGGVLVTVPDRDDLAQLLSQTILGAVDAAVATDGVLHIGDKQHVVLTATKLPSVTHHGAIVEALMRSRSRSVASLHLCPVDPEVARRVLDRRAAMHKYAAREGNDEVGNRVAIADTSSMLAALAQRDVRACRLALTVAVGHPTRHGALEAAERMSGLLAGQGFDMTAVTGPGLLPALALTPGGSPLRRSLQLTSDDVAACLLPALGTPFADHRQPLVGISEATGGPVYLSVWSCPNHNAVIVGTSGAGKSAAAKTLLVRHAMEGSSAVVIDPDSEYRRVMNAIGGVYFELGQDALNPLAAGVDASPDIAAALLLPVLSVMAGDEKGLKDGRPIRRLLDEDQGWLFGEIAAFYRHWRGAGRAREPLMRDLVSFIDTESASRVLTVREEERCRIIAARLRRFTQGDRARVFDRPSTFSVGTTPVAIGLRTFAMTYAADLTAALAVVLTEVLAALGRGTGRLIVVVDEAHRVTVDPDAGEVLAQLVRQARKHGAGVWMCSQRVEDFIGNDLGRTLAATAATKLLLGCEEASIADLKDVFKLRDDEVAALNPPVQGRGVLLSGAQRTVVRVLPGPAILAVAETTPFASARSAHRRDP